MTIVQEATDVIIHDISERRMYDGDVITDEDQCRLIQIRDNVRDAYFEIGDIANRYIEDSAREVDLKLPAVRVYEAVSRFCGKSARTVRYYAEVAAFFPEHVREPYSMLPFSFFVYAKTKSDLWDEVLHLAAASPHMTLEGLKFAFNDGLVTGSSYADEPRQSYDMSNFDISDNSYRLSRSQMLSNFSDLIDRMATILENIPLPGTLRERLIGNLNELRSLVPEIVDALEQESEL